MKRNISCEGGPYSGIPPGMSPCLMIVALCGLLAATFGCSKHYEDRFSRARPPVFKTSGRVTWNGSPAAGATVALQSRTRNLAASGTTDRDGMFTLTTWRPGDGAVAGEHLVTITTSVTTGFTPEGRPIQENDMPPKYSDPEKSGLTTTISEKGKNVLSFEVVGPPQIPKKAAKQ